MKMKAPEAWRNQRATEAWRAEIVIPAAPYAVKRIARVGILWRATDS